MMHPRAVEAIVGASRTDRPDERDTGRTIGAPLSDSALVLALNRT